MEHCGITRSDFSLLVSESTDFDPAPRDNIYYHQSLRAECGNSGLNQTQAEMNEQTSANESISIGDHAISNERQPQV